VNTPARPRGPFVDNLRLVLRVRGMEAAELADAALLPPRKVARWLRGEVRPRLEDVPVLARVLGVAPADLAWTQTETLKLRLRERAG
jgi:transcriptional regulator with XRE-family HTH domain